jgi:hypothetical protein
MSDLANQTPASTYKGLLQVGDYTDGVDSTVKAVLDGEGTASALAIGTTKVGVGTTSPSQELDVSGNVVADEYALDQTGSSSSAVAIHAPATNELAIRTNSTERLRIDSDGRCGIGTASPVTKLDINEVAGNLDVIQSFSKGGVGQARVGLCGATSQILQDALANDLCIRSDGHNIKFGTASATRTDMTIDSDGKVGIGTTTPSRELNVHTDQQETRIVVDNAGADNNTYGGWIGSNGDQNRKLHLGTKFNSLFETAVTIDSDGNCGIGIETPSAPLEVASTTGGVIMPRMNTTQRTAISSPTPGEMVYDTDLNKFYGYTSSGWTALH